MCERPPIVIERQRITRPGQLGLGFTPDDGLGLWQPREYVVRDCIIDLSSLPLDMLDEAAAVTWGASAVFLRCVIRGAGKLILCGSGDPKKAALEAGKRVVFEHCILEDFGRRGVEVQAGMRVTLNKCLVRHWGKTSRHTVRDFASWAHHGGRIYAKDTIFWQDRFLRPFPQFWGDLAAHIGQAWNDYGWRGLMRRDTYLPGVCRAVLAGPGGTVIAWHCWANRWWIAVPPQQRTGTRAYAMPLVRTLELMANRLDAELPPASAA